MGEPKTVPTERRVDVFLAAIPDDARRVDCKELCRLLGELTGEPPVLWGDSIVGFGSRRYRYASGREGDWPRIGFSPRKHNLTLYFADGLDAHQDLLGRLGKHKTGKGCLYLKRLSDADPAVLKELVRRSTADLASFTATPDR